MAEGLLRSMAGDRFTARSAGTLALKVSPGAIEAMAELGIDICGHKSEHVDSYLGTGVATVITVCDRAASNCPTFPERARKVRWSFEGPSRSRRQRRTAQGRLSARARRDRDGVASLACERHGADETRLALIPYLVCMVRPRGCQPLRFSGRRSARIYTTSLWNRVGSGPRWVPRAAVLIIAATSAGHSQLQPSTTRA